MTVVITDFERPDPSLEYEEIVPLPKGPITKPPVITPQTVNCCGCQPGNTTLCQPEQNAGTALASDWGWSISHLFAS